MIPSSSAWKRLTAAARLAPDEGDMAAPYGFATRVVALAMSSSRPAPSLVQQFSLRALGVAVILTVSCVALNLGAILRQADEDPVASATDPVAELQNMDLS